MSFREHDSYYDGCLGDAFDDEIKRKLPGLKPSPRPAKQPATAKSKSKSKPVVVAKSKPGAAPALPPTYVTAGSRVRWHAVYSGGTLVTLRPWRTILADFKSRLEKEGFYDTSVDLKENEDSIIAEVSVPVDMASISDTASVIRGAAQAAGFVVYSDEIAFVARAGQGTTPAPVETGRAKRPGISGGSSSGGFFDSLGMGLGLSTPVVVTAGILIAIIALKR